MNLLEKYCKDNYIQIIFTLLLRSVTVGFTLFLPFAFTYLVNDVVPKNSKNLLWLWTAALIAIAAAIYLLNLYTTHLSTKVGLSISKKLRIDLFTKSAYLDSEKVDNLGISSIISRLTSDISHIQVFISKLLTKGVTAFLLFFGSLVSTSLLDKKLALAIFAVIPLIILTIYFTTKISYKRFLQSRIAQDSLVRSIRENVLGIRVVRAFATFENELKKFQNTSNTVRKKNIHAGIIGNIGFSAMKLWVDMGIVATLLLGAYYIKSSQSNVASLIAFMSYFTMVLMSLIGIGHLFSMYASFAAASTRITEVLNLQNRKYTQEENPHKSEHYIEFRNVSFSYDKINPTLKNINFHIKKGQTFGIIGSTGSGKSTIISLLLRLYEPTEGEIFLENKPINSFTQEELYKKFGVIFQTDVIFADSVSENIAFGREISQEKIELASSCAQAHSYINKLKNKFDTLLDIRGQNMSGGEKQRILISRALANAPQILILDDATNALDYETEANLRVALKNNYTDSTKIFISQRVASIIHADEIIVLEKGSIIAKGTHANLVQQCDIYTQITQAQLGDSKLYS